MNYLYAPLLYVCYIRRFVCICYDADNNNRLVYRQKTIKKETIAHTTKCSDCFLSTLEA